MRRAEVLVCVFGNKAVRIYQFGAHRECLGQETDLSAVNWHLGWRQENS